jgi:hypothetical protein
MRTKDQIKSLETRIEELELKLWKMQNPPKYKRGDKVFIGVYAYTTNTSFEWAGIIAQVESETTYSRTYLVIPDNIDMPAQEVNENYITKK